MSEAIKHLRTVLEASRNDELTPNGGVGYDAACFLDRVDAGEIDADGWRYLPELPKPAQDVLLAVDGKTLAGWVDTLGRWFAWEGDVEEVRGVYAWRPLPPPPARKDPA